MRNIRSFLWLTFIPGFFVISCINTFQEPSIDCATSGPELSLTSKTDTDCGMNEGTIKVNATGNAEPFRFSINMGLPQDSGIFVGLSAGTYLVEVFDQNNCSAAISVIIQNLNGINIDVTTTNSGCETSLGSITVTGAGGETPYQFSLDDGSFSENNTFSNLASGEYTVTAKDNTGCEISKTVDIKTGVSYAGTIKSIIQTNCAVSGCHAGSVSPDLRQLSTIQQQANIIKAVTGNRTMPKEGSLTQNEIDAIACWVEDGALDN